MALSATSSGSIPESPMIILNTSQPVLTALRRYDPVWSPGLPRNDLLSLLPIAALLKLRQMSRATKAWVDTAKSSVFDRICIAFPLEKSSVEALSALNGIASHCSHLTVCFNDNNDDEPTRPGSATLPLMPRLTHIRLKCPNSDAFYPLLSFRHAIESQDFRKLTHLEIYDLTFGNILALRWGTFSSYGKSDAASTRIWRRLKHLDIKMFLCGLAVPNTEITGKEKEDRRTGFKVLHDWLKSFASTDHLEILKFEWEDYDGPNPLLLDLKATDGPAEKWFSAPKIEWKGLKEVHLRGVQVTEADMVELYKRMEDLRTVIAQPGRRSSPINAREVVVDNSNSMGILADRSGHGLYKQPDDAKGLVAVGCAVDDLLNSLAAGRSNAVEAEDGLGHLRQGLATRLESVRASNVTGISDSSWEVPFMLDIAAERNGSC
ncbi:hypothetical protein JMJ35_002181 [Cladonia borealis]|uniref:Uncharacterized protein n=1 Tax=Cladonia borealis TaxID=184061 RepID=A0AA39R4N1_9LECA|nr:hypothetical protein JMJ35_002181 [Cladonia borealis]